MNFRELRYGELLRIPLPRRWVNRAPSGSVSSATAEVQYNQACQQHTDGKRNGGE